MRTYICCTVFVVVCPLTWRQIHRAAQSVAVDMRSSLLRRRRRKNRHSKWHKFVDAVLFRVQSERCLVCIWNVLLRMFAVFVCVFVCPRVCRGWAYMPECVCTCVQTAPHHHYLFYVVSVCVCVFGNVLSSHFQSVDGAQCRHAVFGVHVRCIKSQTLKWCVGVGICAMRCGGRTWVAHALRWNIHCDNHCDCWRWRMFWLLNYFKAVVCFRRQICISAIFFKDGNYCSIRIFEAVRIRIVHYI